MTPSLGAQRLREWRDGAGITQREAADRLEIDFVQYSKYERGVVTPGRTRAALIEKVTGGRSRVVDWDVPAPAEDEKDTAKATG